MTTNRTDQQAAEEFTKGVIALAAKHACRVHVFRSKLGEIRVQLEAPGVNVLVQLWGIASDATAPEENDRLRMSHLDRLTAILREGMMPLPKFGPAQEFFGER